jgi:hypothetical protein
VESSSFGNFADNASQRVHSIVSAAEQEATALLREVELEAELIRRQAEDQAQQIIEGARAEADRLVRERTGHIAALGEEVGDRTQQLLQRMDGAAEVKRQLEALMLALAEAAESLAGELGPVAQQEPEAPAVQPVPRREPALRREYAPPPPPSPPPAPAGGPLSRRVAPRVPRPAPRVQPARVQPARLQPQAERQEMPAADRAVDSQFDGARLVALQMAVAGSTRAEVEVELQRAFSLDDPAPILDDVFGDGGARRTPAGR